MRPKQEKGTTARSGPPDFTLGRFAGRPISQPDAQIAAIAVSRGAAVATRNVADFEGCGITLMDPWTS
jgi:toxin FitB